MTFDPVAEAEQILASCNIRTWKQKVAAEEAKLGRSLSLGELLSLAKGHEMTATEIEEQRQSWARQMKD